MKVSLPDWPNNFVELGEDMPDERQELVTDTAEATDPAILFFLTK